MTIDARFVILWNFEFFEKRTWYIMVYIMDVVYITSTKETLVLNLAKIDWSIQIFSDFEFFENFFKVF